MRIVSKGVDPKEQLYRHVCGPCKTMVEFKLADLKRTDDYREGTYYSYDCPVCRESHNFAHSALGRYKYNPEDE